MQEILTPVQFEPALDVLNQINKLTISQKASLSLDAMQACKNPVGHGNPIIGKFCREDKQGALCCISDEKFVNVELQVGGNPGGVTRYLTLTFENQIQGLAVWSSGYTWPPERLYWAVPEGAYIMPTYVSTWIYLPFVGKNITFCLNTDHMYLVAGYGLYY